MRAVVVAGRDGERGLTEMFIKSRKEYYKAAFLLLKEGYDFIQVFPY